MESTSTTTTTRPSSSTERRGTSTPSWSLQELVRSQASYGRSVISLIRVRQWVKNLFLFIPSFFAGHLFKTEELLMVGIGALAFSLVASGVYVINDYRDRFVDRLHPTKKLRPIASGEIGPVSAWMMMAVLITAGFFIAATLDMAFFYILLTYFVMNMAYSFGLKNIPIVDLFIVSLGFLLRIYSGGV